MQEIAENRDRTIAVRAAPVLMPGASRIDLTVEEGMTLAEIVAAALPGASPASLARLNVALTSEHGSVTIDARYWHRVRPRGGVSVVIRIVPGNDKLKGILSIVVAIAAIAAGAFLAPIIAGSEFGLALGWQASTWQALLGLGVITAGTIAINALIPAPTLADQRSPKANYQITGWANAYQPDGVVPMVMGRQRYAPPFALAPYTEIIDGKQYVLAAFCFGYGELEFSGHRIGDTPLTDFDHYKIQERSGGTGGSPLDLFPNQVIEKGVGTELIRPLPRNDRGEVIDGPSIETPVRRTLASDANKASIILLFPSGLIKYDNDGDEKSLDVDIRVRSRPVGSASWTFSKTLTIREKTRDPFYRQFTWNLSPRGLFEVEVTRETHERVDSQQMDRVQLVALQSFRPEYPLNFDAPLALVGIRIRASYQLSGSLDNYNAIAQRVCLDWDHVTATWISRATRNPASLYRHALQSPANPRPAADGGIDLAALADWHDFCRLKDLKYDRVHDFESSIADTLSVIAAAGRASPRYDGVKWSVVIDRPQSVIVDHINPRNSRQMRWERTYFEPPHAYRVPFLDQTNNYESAERLVRWPGYSGDITVTEQIDLPGKTDPDEIYIEARRRMHEARYRPDAVTVIQDGAARIATRGDKVMLNYDVLARTQVAARVVRVLGTRIELDDVVSMTADETYAIRYRVHADGADVVGESVLARIMTIAGDHMAVTVADTVAMPAAGAIVHFGPMASESEAMIVKSVEPGEDMASVLTLVAASEPIDEATDAEVPPAWSSRIGAEITAPTEPGIPTITAILSGLAGTDDPGGLIVFVAPDPESQVQAASFEIDHRLVGAPSWTTVPVDLASGSASLTGYARGDAVEIRARALSITGVTGPYCTVVDVTVGEIDDDMPADLPADSITVTGGLGTAVSEGATGTDPATAYIQIYRSATGVLDPVADKVGEPIRVYPRQAWFFTDGDPSRKTLLVNGGFDTNKGWSVTGGWAIADGVAAHAPGTTGFVDRSVTVTAAKTYRCGVTIAARTAGSVTPRFLGGTTVGGGAAAANGIAVDTLVAASGNVTFGYNCTSDFDGEIDDMVLYLQTANCLPQGTAYYWFQPLNAQLTGGTISGPFPVTII